MVAGAVDPGGTIGGLGAPPIGIAGSGIRKFHHERRVERRDRRCDRALTRFLRAAWLCLRLRRFTHRLPATPAPTATTTPIACLDEGLHQGPLSVRSICPDK